MSSFHYSVPKLYWGPVYPGPFRVLEFLEGLNLTSDLDVQRGVVIRVSVGQSVLQRRVRQLSRSPSVGGEIAQKIMARGVTKSCLS